MRRPSDDRLPPANIRPPLACASSTWLCTLATAASLINEAAVAKVQSQVEDAQAKGGRILAGGKRSSLGLRILDLALYLGHGRLVDQRPCCTPCSKPLPT